MADNNYENLGFQVKVDGADSAVSNLDRIINRLERINELQGKKIRVSKQGISTQIQEEKQTKRNTQSLGAYLAKLTSVAVVARRLGSFVSSAIQESASYVENLNLFAVAYGDVYQDTLKWALELADGFGLASNEVLKFAGTFRQLSTSLGIVEDTANSVSKTVTQLGYDISALFNTSVENAMEKLQSGLFSGNVRPLRAYGIDISQNQIDALFETNEALASLGVNARNLSQSDKVLARLIITLRDGSNAFGTMNREINTLQSQIRILQGSFSNFKLAIGDLVYEPIRQALVMLNAFIIAATNIIRIFAPRKTKDENNVFNGVAMGAEEANNEIDELNGKLATFDKFNVLGGQSQSGTNDAITKALTDELAKQQEYYKQQVDLMDDTENEAKELAKALEPLIVLFAGLVGVKIYSWAKGAIEAAKAATLAGESLTGVAKAGAVLQKVFSPKGLGVIAVATAFAYMYTTNEEFRNSITNLISSISSLVSNALSPFLTILNGITPAITTILNIVARFVAWVANVIASVIELVDKCKIFEGVAWAIVGVLGIMVAFRVGEFFIGLADSIKTATKAIGAFMKTSNMLWVGLGLLVVGIAQVVSAWQDMSWAHQLLTVIGSITAGIIGIVVALNALKLGLPAALGIGAALTGGVLLISSQFKSESVQGFANGGYSNANLIMTHENGKREAIMKQGKSNVIMNDMQMTDIMETAVAKGVVLGNRALNSQNQSGSSTKNIYNFQVNGRTLLSVMEDEMHKQGKKLSRY